MADEATPDERQRARELAHRTMLVSAWEWLLVVAGSKPEAVDWIAERVTGDLEALLTHVGGRDAEVTRHLAIAEMEGMWAEIRTRLASPRKPKADEPPQD